MGEKKEINPDQLYATTELNLKKFIAHKNGGNALLLYLAYQQQSKYQKTNQSRSTDKFMMKKLLRGQSKFQTAKKILKDMGFIEIVSRRKNGVISEWYVKVNYMINLDGTKYTTPKNIQNQDSGEGITNAGSSKEKCLNKKKIQHQNTFDVIYNSFGLDKQYIEEAFGFKKSLDRIYELCEAIKELCERLDMKPEYDKDGINAMDIMFNRGETIDSIEKRIIDNGRDGQEYFSHLIREDYYLPEEMVRRY